MTDKALEARAQLDTRHMSVDEIAAKTLELAREARQAREAGQQFENKNVVALPSAAKHQEKKISPMRKPTSKPPPHPTLFDITNSKQPPHETLATTHPGQAHYARTGPSGAACGECAFFNRSKIIVTKAGNRKLVHYNCEKFFQFTGKHGPAFPASASACRHFQRKA